MDIDDFLIQFPTPPRIARNAGRHSFTVQFSEDEWRTLQKVANHEAFRSAYNGHQADVVRHTFYYMINEIEDRADRDLQYSIDRLRNALVIQNHQTSRDSINEVLDSTAVRLNILLDFDELDGALAEYETYLDEVAKLPAHWRRILAQMAGQHAELERFRARTVGNSLQGALQLKALEEMDR